MCKDETKVTHLDGRCSLDCLQDRDSCSPPTLLIDKREKSDDAHDQCSVLSRITQIGKSPWPVRKSRIVVFFSLLRSTLGFSRHSRPLSPWSWLLPLSCTYGCYWTSVSRKIGSNANCVRGRGAQKQKGFEYGGGRASWQISRNLHPGMLRSLDNDMLSGSSMVQSRVVIIRKLRAIVAKVRPLNLAWVVYGVRSMRVLGRQRAIQSP